MEEKGNQKRRASAGVDVEGRGGRGARKGGKGRGVPGTGVKGAGGKGGKGPDLDKFGRLLPRVRDRKKHAPGRKHAMQSALKLASLRSSIYA